MFTNFLRNIQYLPKLFYNKNSNFVSSLQEDFRWLPLLKIWQSCLFKRSNFENQSLHLTTFMPNLWSVCTRVVLAARLKTIINHLSLISLCNKALILDYELLLLLGLTPEPAWCVLIKRMMAIFENFHVVIQKVCRTLLCHWCCILPDVVDYDSHCLRDEPNLAQKIMDHYEIRN